MKKVISIALTLVLVMGLQLGLTNYAQADSALPDGTYPVPVKLMKATDTTKLSMAEDALVTPGQLDVVDGQWFLTVNLQTLYIGIISGSASDIKYYEDGVGSPLHEAEVVASDDNGIPKTVKMPVELDSEGIYINMHVEAGFFITMNPDAYIKYTVPQVYEIAADAGDHGAIDPEGTVAVVEGENQSFTVTPDEGYHIKDVKVDDVSMGAQGSYDFAAVDASHTIVAEFEEDAPLEYTITADAGDYGTIDPEGTITVAEGEDQSFTITPEEGYHIKDVKVDGVSVGAQASYDFTDMGENHTITAEFEANPPEEYAITAGAGDHGIIDPEGTVMVLEGEDQSFTITPDAGYHIKDVKVDDVSVGAQASYDFTDMDGNHTIMAEFEEDEPVVVEYLITSGADQELVEGNQGDPIVIDGDFDHFLGVWVDGEEIVMGTDYTAVSGSTIVTFSQSFLDSLTVGAHQIQIKYDNGMVATQLTIREKDSNNGSHNGENTGIHAAKNEDMSGKAGSVTKVNGDAKDHSAKTGDGWAMEMGLLLLALSGVSLLALRKKGISK